VLGGVFLCLDVVRSGTFSCVGCVSWVLGDTFCGTFDQVL